MKYRVYVYAICKNESLFAERWYNSVKEADAVIVTDTGSTDGTVELLKSLGATVHSETVEPWRFDAARNLSLSYVPEDADICVCCDIDEVFEPGWRAKLEAVWDENPIVVQNCGVLGKYTHIWSSSTDAEPTLNFMCPKIHQRDGFRWKYPIHECLEYIGSKRYFEMQIPEVVIYHKPDPNKSRSSYLPLLEIAVKEMPNDSRMNFYLGREYMYIGDWQNCIRTLKKYLSLSIWSEERCAATRYIAFAYKESGEFAEAIKWYNAAIAECPYMREPYVDYAVFCRQQGDFAMEHFLSSEALRIANKSDVYINEAYCWDGSPEMMLNEAREKLLPLKGNVSLW